MPIYERPPDVEAKITFVSAEQGGRKAPIHSGYRPQFHYSEELWDAEHEYPEVESVLPGQTVRVLLRFTKPEAHAEQIQGVWNFESKKVLA